MTTDMWDNWTQPTSVRELLERSLERAKVEENWCTGAIVRLKDSELGASSEEPTCTNVEACAMGIVLIEWGDGQFIEDWNKYSDCYVQNNYYDYRGDENDPQWQKEYPILGKAVKTLARAFGLKGNFSYTDAVAHVELVNDKKSPYCGSTSADWDKQKHHAAIVEGFEKAVEIERSHETS